MLITTSLQIRMTFLESWEEFEKAAERLYLQDPMKVRYFYDMTYEINWFKNNTHLGIISIKFL